MNTFKIGIYVFYLNWNELIFVFFFTNEKFSRRKVKSDSDWNQINAASVIFVLADDHSWSVA